jgi:Zn-dependent protease
MFGAPTTTPYDLRFSVAGIPVRVHPLFWLLAFLLGFRPGDPAAIFIWVGAVFVSILVHELGHAFTMRYFGYNPAVVLYMGGGLAMYHGDNDSPWTNYSGSFGRGRDRPWAKIIIAAAGPAAGFLLAGIVVAYMLLGGVTSSLLGVEVGRGEGASHYLNTLIVSLLFINIFWGVINLFPIYPLDGGQIARELFQMFSYDGVRQSLWLSLIAAAGLSLVGFGLLREPFMGIMFAYFGFMNWQMLNMQGGGGGFGGGYGGGRW